MQVRVLEPRGELWQGRAKQVSLPGEGGEICVLDWHQSLLVRLTNGYIGLDSEQIPVEDGIALMQGNELTILILIKGTLPKEVP